MTTFQWVYCVGVVVTGLVAFVAVVFILTPDEVDLENEVPRAIEEGKRRDEHRQADDADDAREPWEDLTDAEQQWLRYFFK